jgi:hypothetical protein
MDLSHSFIVKVWLEESIEEAGDATWRGHITHVPGEERRYLHTLDDIVEFIGPYLERMGVKPRSYRRSLRARCGAQRRSQRTLSHSD